jgi:hypothetical protein
MAERRAHTLSCADQPPWTGPGMGDKLNLWRFRCAEKEGLLGWGEHTES